MKLILKNESIAENLKYYQCTYTKGWLLVDMTNKNRILMYFKYIEMMDQMAFEIYFKICIHQDFPDSPVVKILELPMQGARWDPWSGN